ncbi:MAG TPA: hypothetical protein VL442_18475 [Mucilaginibacter sp.]|nr:hypothetical protein [Mucilaginibacter sp.]
MAQQYANDLDRMAVRYRLSDNELWELRLVSASQQMDIEHYYCPTLTITALPALLNDLLVMLWIHLDSFPVNVTKGLTPDKTGYPPQAITMI